MDGRPNPTVILVLGILSLIFCAFLGIPAWIMGNNALAVAGSYPESDLNLIKIGRVLGIIATVLMAASLAIWHRCGGDKRSALRVQVFV